MGGRGKYVGFLIIVPGSLSVTLEYITFLSFTRTDGEVGNMLQVDGMQVYLACS